jgi:hypothetical protein
MSTPGNELSGRSIAYLFPRQSALQVGRLISKNRELGNDREKNPKTETGQLRPAGKGRKRLAKSIIHQIPVVLYNGNLNGIPPCSQIRVC